MERDEIIELVRQSLRIKVETTREYTGGMDGESLYRDQHTIQLIFDNEVISETYL